MALPPCTANPAGLSNTIKSSSISIIVCRTKSMSSARSVFFSRSGLSGISAIGGTRISCPATNRMPALARFPSTRTWPVLSSFCKRPRGRSGKCRKNQRSNRWSASKSPTFRCCTPLTAAPSGLTAYLQKIRRSIELQIRRYIHRPAAFHRGHARRRRPARTSRTS